MVPALADRHGVPCRAACVACAAVVGRGVLGKLGPGVGAVVDEYVGGGGSGVARRVGVGTGEVVEHAPDLVPLGGSRSGGDSGASQSECLRVELVRPDFQGFRREPAHVFPGGCRVAVHEVDVGRASYEHGEVGVGGLPWGRYVVCVVRAVGVHLGCDVDLDLDRGGIGDPGLCVDGGEVRLDVFPECGRDELPGGIEGRGHGGGHLVPGGAGLPV